SLLTAKVMTLDFEIFELASLALATAVVAAVVSDGRSNWYEGALLVMVYAVIAVAFFFHPPLAHGLPPSIPRVRTHRERRRPRGRVPLHGHQQRDDPSDSAVLPDSGPRRERPHPRDRGRALGQRRLVHEDLFRPLLRCRREAEALRRGGLRPLDVDEGPVPVR